MNNNSGVWIDHRKAVIVVLSGDAAATSRIASEVQKHEHRDDVNDDTRQKEFTEHISRYYDRVIAALSGAGSILIMGPGEAKEELHKRFHHHRHDSRPIAVETTAPMTEPEIAAKVRRHFHDDAPRIGV
ncbi:MAG: hypothetical protein ACHQ51_06845 [Elusimicrobiota bacterium]